MGETQVNKAVRITLNYSLLSGLVGLLAGAIGVGMVLGTDRSQIHRNAEEIGRMRQMMEQMAGDLSYLRGKFDGNKPAIGGQQTASVARK